MTAPRLLLMGGIVVDIVRAIDRLPEAGAEVTATGRFLQVGGGMNLLVAATRCGLPAAYGGRHGSGPFGELVRRALAAAGVAVLQPASDGDSGSCIVLVTPDGERSFVTATGAEAELDAATLAAIRPTPADWIHVSGYTLAYPTSGPALAAWLAAVPGDPWVSFDPGPLAADIPADRLAAVLAHCRWVSCNAREAALLTGLPAPLAAASALRSRLGRPDGGVVVRLGPAGCLVATADAVRTVAGFAVDAVDSNGAGDTHLGAFTAALASGAGAPEAAVFANAAAALLVARRGPDRAPWRADVERLAGTRSTEKLH